MPQPNVRAESDLVALLVAQANSLQSAAPDVAMLLRSHAEQISASPSAAQALVAFGRFAEHYKGLADVVVPHENTDEWASFVLATRRLSRAALRARSLDGSIIGRVQAFMHRFRSAP